MLACQIWNRRSAAHGGPGRGLVRALVFLTGFYGIALSPVRANPSPAELSSASVHTASSRVKPGEWLPIAVRFRMAEGWHTYAKEPGDSGMPPSIELKGPRGLEVAPWRFPPHQTFKDAAGTTYGYENEVVLLSALRLPAAYGEAKSLAIEVAVAWMICRDICVFRQATFPLNLKTAAEMDAPLESWDVLLKAGGWTLRDGEKERARGPGKETKR